MAKVKSGLKHRFSGGPNATTFTDNLSANRAARPHTTCFFKVCCQTGVVAYLAFMQKQSLEPSVKPEPGLTGFQAEALIYWPNDGYQRTRVQGLINLNAGHGHFCLLSEIGDLDPAEELL